MRNLVWIASLLFVGSCGGKSELLGAGGNGGRTDSGTPGFVQCGAVSCDVGSGNMCYFCAKTEPPICHTMDLPTQCSAPVFRLCDGDEDCEPDERCSESCPVEGPCSSLERICRG